MMRKKKSGSKIKAVRPGTYLIEFRGSETLEAAQRHDLAATNEAVSRIISRRTSQPVQLNVSVYGVQGHEVVISGKRKNSMAGAMMFDVNVYNVLLSESKDKGFCFLARESSELQRGEGSHDVYLFMCKSPEEAELIASALTQVTRTFFETIREARRSSGDKALAHARPDEEWDIVQEKPESATALRAEFDRMLGNEMLHEIAEVDEDEYDEAEGANDDDDEEFDDLTFANMLAGLEKPTADFKRRLSKKLVRKGTKEIKLRRRASRMSRRGSAD